MLAPTRYYGDGQVLGHGRDIDEAEFMCSARSGQASLASRRPEMPSCRQGSSAMAEHACSPVMGLPVSWRNGSQTPELIQAPTLKLRRRERRASSRPPLSIRQRLAVPRKRVCARGSSARARRIAPPTRPQPLSPFGGGVASYLLYSACPRARSHGHGCPAAMARS